MRFFITVIVWVVFIGGLGLYMKTRGVPDVSSDFLPEVTPAEKTYTLEITPSFVLETDPFALTVDGQYGAPALLVRLGKHDILRVEDSPIVSKIYKVDPLQGLIIGKNELYIEASPPVNHLPNYNALRVLITENGHPFAEKTIWASPGAKVSGIVQFSVTAHHGELIEEKHGPDQYR